MGGWWWACVFRFSLFFGLLLLLALKLTPVAKLICVIGAEVPVAPDVQLTAEEKREEKVSNEGVSMETHCCHS